MKKLFLSFSALFICTVCCNAQTNIWNSKHAYLGLKPPGDEPQIFAKGLLIDSGIVLGRIAFSNDGKEFYYTYARHWFDFRGTGIRRIAFDGNKWAKPQILFPDLNNPTFSIDNNTLYLSGRNSEVWTSNRADTGWTSPVKWLDVARSGLYDFMPTQSGNYYIGSNGDRSNKKDYSAYDFSVLTISGRDTIIKSLGETVNTNGFDGDFYIAPDESYIIISAKETPSFECELWISFQKKDKSWTAPLSLGPEINTGLAHRFGQYVSPDGKYLFYTKGTGEKDCNFYWVRFDTLLKKLRAKAGIL